MDARACKQDNGTVHGSVRPSRHRCVDMEYSGRVGFLCDDLIWREGEPRLIGETRPENPTPTTPPTFIKTAIASPSYLCSLGLAPLSFLLGFCSPSHIGGGQDEQRQATRQPQSLRSRFRSPHHHSWFLFSFGYIYFF